METEEYYIRQKWKNLYFKGLVPMQHDRFLIENVLMFPKLITSAGSLPQEEEIWAWNEITANFNDKQSRRMNLLASDLKARYNLLKPLILTQTTLIPESPLTAEMLTTLRSITKNMRWDHTQTMTKSQMVLKENIPWLLTLPEARRKVLEAKITEIMLNAELRALGEAKYMSEEDFKKLENNFCSDLKRMKLDLPAPKPPLIVIEDVEEAIPEPRRITRRSEIQAAQETKAVSEEPEKLLVENPKRERKAKPKSRKSHGRKFAKAVRKLPPKKKTTTTTTETKTTTTTETKTTSTIGCELPESYKRKAKNKRKTSTRRSVPPQFIDPKDAHSYVQDFVIVVKRLDLTPALRRVKRVRYTK